jgi:hypothetical protein
MLGGATARRRSPPLDRSADIPRPWANVPGPYFSPAAWPPFVYQGYAYSLAHLDSYEFQVTDADQQSRVIAVTFADHCFTRKEKPGDDPALIYPQSDRKPGVFCFTRYNLSLGLKGFIAQASTGSVWNVDYGGFAAVPVVTSAGTQVLYGIVFSLDPVSGLPVHLHMRVKSAHPRDVTELVTFGKVRFKHLVALRAKGARPKLLHDRNRKRPHNPAM